ncbi:hypothetical protein [Acetivibrio straminisolvens]|jgi:hypothetical protein|uniref:Uncharacterized protein n=1 Tax=Acetivibrio straminisolvens JCM 21531 TaxID=1294263 RepID=W4V3T3_9FIRM|nr:hypothetical protein [Acetivibrio straminisolvens]GAE87856.1 hypothetical protein JCM21531_1258 [Acetivibrio straminisolvens JCM 21531]
MEKRRNFTPEEKAKIVSYQLWHITRDYVGYYYMPPRNMEKGVVMCQPQEW